MADEPIMLVPLEPFNPKILRHLIDQQDFYDVNSEILEKLCTTGKFIEEATRELSALENVFDNATALKKFVHKKANLRNILAQEGKVVWKNFEGP